MLILFKISKQVFWTHFVYQNNGVVLKTSLSPYLLSNSCQINIPIDQPIQRIFFLQPKKPEELLEDIYGANFNNSYISELKAWETGRLIPITNCP